MELSLAPPTGRAVKVVDCVVRVEVPPVPVEHLLTQLVQKCVQDGPQNHALCTADLARAARASTLVAISLFLSSAALGRLRRLL